MNEIQERLLELASKNDLSQISLRKTAKMIGNESMSPGVLQYHFTQLERKVCCLLIEKQKSKDLGLSQLMRDFIIYQY